MIRVVQRDSRFRHPHVYVVMPSWLYAIHPPNLPFDTLVAHHHTYHTVQATLARLGLPTDDPLSEVLLDMAGVLGDTSPPSPPGKEEKGKPFRGTEQGKRDGLGEEMNNTEIISPSSSSSSSSSSPCSSSSHTHATDPCERDTNGDEQKKQPDSTWQARLKHSPREEEVGHDDGEHISQGENDDDVDQDDDDPRGDLPWYHPSGWISMRWRR